MGDKLCQARFASQTRGKVSGFSLFVFQAVLVGQWNLVCPLPLPPPGRAELLSSVPSKVNWAVGPLSDFLLI